MGLGERQNGAGGGEIRPEGSQNWPKWHMPYPTPLPGSDLLTWGKVDKHQLLNSPKSEFTKWSLQHAKYPHRINGKPCWHHCIGLRNLHRFGLPEPDVIICGGVCVELPVFPYSKIMWK